MNPDNEAKRASRKKIWFWAGLLLLVGVLGFFWSRVEKKKIEEMIHKAGHQIGNVENDDIDQRNTEIHKILTEFADAFEDKKFTMSLVEHASLALIVAAILLVTVELYSRQQLREEVNQYRAEVAASVWRAVSGRMLGEKSLREIDSILKSSAVRRNNRYVIRLLPPPPGVPPGHTIVQRELHYKVSNLTGIEGYPYTIRVTIDSRFPDIEVEQDGTRKKVPRLECLRVDGKDVDLEKALLEHDPRSLEHTIHLPRSPERAVEVYSCTQEMVEASDSYRSTMLTLSEGLSLSFVNEASSVVRVKAARLHHPNWKNFKESVKDTWEFEGGLLPGQGFTLWWESVDK